MSAHLTVAQGLAVGVTTGAVAAGAVAEWFLTRLRDQLDTAHKTGRNQELAILLLEEELEDTIAERDGFRAHLDDVIDCSLGETALDRARRMHPAGGRHGTWPLRVVGDDFITETLNSDRSNA